MVELHGYTTVRAKELRAGAACGKFPFMSTIEAPLRADDRRRVVLPAPATPGSYWVPVAVSAQEIVLRAWQPPAGRKSPSSLAVMKHAPVKGDAAASLRWKDWE